MISLVCGGRDFKDKDCVFSVLDGLSIDAVVHGGADGADRLAGEWAISRKVPEIIVPAQWKGYGKSAGPIRNQWMLDFTKVDTVIAFPGGRGTANMVNLAREAELMVIVIGRT